MLPTFGDILGEDEEGIEIGKKIIQVLNKNGLTTSWNNQIGDRIKITDIKWEKQESTESWLEEIDKAVLIIEDKILIK